MGSRYELQVIDAIEFSRHLGPKVHARATVSDRPSVDVIGVRPHQVTEGTLMRKLHASINEIDLIKCFDFWRKSAMNAKDLAFDEGCNAEIVEHFAAILPRVDVAVFAHSFFVETVY